MSWSHEVGFGQAVVPRRTARAVGRNLVVGASHRAVVIGRPDGQRRTCIARRSNPGETEIAVCVDTVVARRYNDDDAGLRRLLDRTNERVGSRWFENRVSER